MVTAISAATLWFVSRIIDIFVSWRRRRNERLNLIRALFAEVDFNTKDLYIFVEMSTALDQIEARFNADKDAVIHVTDAHHTLIYTSNVGQLHYLDDRLAARLVHFYGLLDKIKAQIDGTHQPSFKAVTASGKLAVVKGLFENVRECEAIGKEVLEEFSATYPKLTLTRMAREVVDIRQR